MSENASVNLREMKELSQENMAESLGMSLAGYSKIERGVTAISLSHLLQIANELAT